jgi:hypothetical protein
VKPSAIVVRVRVGMEMAMWMAIGAGSALAAGCAAPASEEHAPTVPSTVIDDGGRAACADFSRAEADALGWLSAADPRLAARTGITAPHEVLDRLGSDAVLTEDTSARIRGASLDPFSFRARTRAVEQAARALSAFRADLPEAGPVGSELRRPRLERELVARLVDEERTRAEDEAKLGDAAGDLVRAVVSTWTPPATPQEVPDRDGWLAAHLLEIRASMQEQGPRTGPPDLDEALYPLERLLSPLQYPRGAAAIAQLRMAIDQDLRVVPHVDTRQRLAHALQVHLGVTVDPSSLPAQFAALAARLGDEAHRRLGAADASERAATLSRARQLLFVETPCPPVADSPVRSMAPPPERAAVCGILHALSDPASVSAAFVALHDEVQISLAAVTDAPPPRTGFLSQPADDDVDALERGARERPAPALGPALAAQIAFADGVDPARIAAWRELGEVPLDVLARELAKR